MTGERNGGAAVPLAETENLGILGKEGVPNGSVNKHRHEAGEQRRQIMKAKLTRVENKTYYFDENGDRHDGVPVGIRGNLSGITGDLTGIRGDLTGIWGDLSGIRGYLSGIRGNLSGIRGDLDDCEITEGDRLRGINIVELIGK